MILIASGRCTPEEYLAFERAAEWKYEYIGGRIVEVPHPNRWHVLICGNLAREIGGALQASPCEAYGGRMRVKITASGSYVYPDLSVAYDPRFEHSDVDDMLLNPVVIAEVLSESTERYDRGEKFQHYRRIESLREYVLISQDKCLVERYVREGHFWHYQSIDDLDGTLTLASVGVEIPLRGIYARVLPAKATPEGQAGTA